MDKFNFAIGRPWYPGDSDSSIGCYNFGNQDILYGTWEQAGNMAAELTCGLTPAELAQGGPYRVYQLIERTE